MECEYKIVEEKDANGKSFYEIWYRRKPTWWNWWKHWVPEMRYGFRYSTVRRFESIEEIFETLNARVRERSIVKHGILSQEQWSVRHI